MMTNIAEMFAEFHTALGDEDCSDRELRKRLHEEEFRELVEAIESGDRVSIAGELADVVYVSYGTAHSLGLDIDWYMEFLGEYTHMPALAVCQRYLIDGLRRNDLNRIGTSLPLVVDRCYDLADRHQIDLDAVVAEVHAANMRKIGPNGPVLVAGKVMKPEGWSPADVAGALAGMRRDG